ncbi:hypothetical protein TL16_g11872 [Triparma laevis f. inornata]|uniref:Uncharacterized protein n=1 Tax=Triparma laevis f. inornata TaxID=1714386 RepID=A0A9W7EU69_9STRA|nr:hypothetical protein TL16_g11872 [Triparma laevis f. inornata]
MKIPDSLQTLGFSAFYGCFKLVPSNIGSKDENAVVAYLSTKQVISIKRWSLPFNSDFYRFIAPFIMDDTLMTMRLVSKPWLAAVDDFIHDEIEDGAMMERCLRMLPKPNIGDGPGLASKLGKDVFENCS